MATTAVSRSNTLAVGTDGNDSFLIGSSTTSVQNVTVQTGAGNDIVNDFGENTVIELGAGNDTVQLFASGTPTVNAGAGNNLIAVAATNNVVINAAGTNSDPATISYLIDSTKGTLNKVTLSGGGNAVLSGNASSRDLFIGGSGTNTVMNYGSEDTIQFNVSSFTTSGDDVVLTNASGGTLIVKNGKGRVLGVSQSAGAAVNYNYYGGTYTTSQQSVIKDFMKSLDDTELSGTEALDEAVNAISGGTVTTMNDLIGSAVKDLQEHGSDTFLRDDCGILLGNADTGAITGWDAGGAKTKTAISVVPESGTVNTSFTADSFTAGGLTFTLEKGFSSLSSTQQRIWQALQTWWASSSLDLISSSYGSNFAFTDDAIPNSGAKNITVKFVSSLGTVLAQVVYSTPTTSTENVTAGYANKLDLEISMKYYKDIDLSNANGKSEESTSTYLDRTIAHEITHAIMASTIYNFHELPAYVKEGMAELTHGIDDVRGNDIKKLVSSPTNLTKALTTNTKTVSSFSGISSPSYAGGYVLLRYMAKKFATFAADNNKSTASGSGVISDDDFKEPPATLVYNKSKTAVTVTADYTDTSLNSSSLYTTVTLIDATKAIQPLLIKGGEKASAISVGNKGGTLMGGSTGADKLYGNSSADVFAYSVGGGKDVVGDSKTGTHTLYQSNDKIVIVGDAASIAAEGYVSFKDSKSALVLSFKGDTKSGMTINKSSAATPVTIELKSALDGSVVKTITHNEIPTGVSLDASSSTAVVTSSATANSTINATTINSQIKTINGLAAEVPVYLVGNSQATAISLGAEGGTVTGGYDYVKDKGLDDKFYGGEGEDVFVYSLGGGKDQIYNFNGKDDKIVLRGFSSVETITTTGDVNYKDGGSSFVLTLGGTVNGVAKKGTLTLINPSDQIRVYKEESDDPILEYGVELPDYTEYNKNKTAVTLGAAADESAEAAASTIEIDLLGDNYPSNVKEIDASAFVGKVNLVGNDKSNALKSAKGGGTLDGGSGEKAATGDKLYGNASSDTFIYRIIESVGGGTDVIGGDAKNTVGNYDSNDKIIITSGTGLTKSDIDIQDKGSVMTLSFKNDRKSKLTINKATANTAVKFYLGASDADLSSLDLAFTHGEIPTGVGYGSKNNKDDYTTLTIGGATANTTVDTSEINSQVKNISMSSSAAVYLVGNANANNISVGAAGGTVNGGAGNDKIYGNTTSTASTTFVYTVGEGNDEINYYDGSKDVILINGYTSAIDPSDTKSRVFKDNGKDIVLTLPNGNATSKLTIKSPTGKLTLLGKDADGNPATLLSYGANLPDSANMGFNGAKTVMTIGGAAQLDGVTTLKLSDYGSTLKELDASRYGTTALHLIGADNKANVLRAGSKGSTLQGSNGNDKLYGNTGSDTFVYTVGTGGKDEIYSLNGAQGDEIILLGYTDTTIDTSDKKKFSDNGKDIVLSLGGNKLTVKTPVGQLKVYSGTLNNDGTITKSANAVLTYDQNLPSGITYNANKTVLTFGSNVAGGALTYSIDASTANAYSNMLKNIDATAYVGSVNLTGNSGANALYSSKESSTLDGGAGADKLFGTTGVKDTFVYTNDGSKDAIFNYIYADGDVVKVSEPSSSGKLRVTYNGKTVVLSYDDTSKGTVTINGKSQGNNKYANIDSATTIAIQIGSAAVKTYQFLSTKVKNTEIANLTSDLAVVSSGSSGGSSQLPGANDEKYWFEPNDVADVADGMADVDELKEIMEVKPLAEIAADGATDFNDFASLDKQRDQMLGANVSARHRIKK